MYVSGAAVDHDEVARMPEIWNFCVYRRYLGGAGDLDSEAWYRRSAEGGCGPAHANLGNYYVAGVHVPRDVRLAATHFQRGADLGDARAQYKLGTLYQQGEGVARDVERAAEWFRRAYGTLARRNP